MTTIPTALSDLADRLEKFRPMRVPEGDDWRYWTLDLQLAAALLGYVNEIHDALQLSESVEYASAFKERFDRLYELLKSDDPNALARFAEMLFDLAYYCRTLAEAIGAKFRDNPPVWNVPRKMLAGRQSAASEQPAKKQPKAIPKNLKDIPRLDKTNGDWVLRAEAAKRTRLSVKYLANITSTSGSRKAKDGVSGIDSRRQMWRKTSKTSQSVWYYVPSLSDKHG